MVKLRTLVSDEIEHYYGAVTLADDCENYWNFNCESQPLLLHFYFFNLCFNLIVFFFFLITVQTLTCEGN